MGSPNRTKKSTGTFSYSPVGTVRQLLRKLNLGYKSPKPTKRQSAIGLTPDKNPIGSVLSRILSYEQRDQKGGTRRKKQKQHKHRVVTRREKH